MENKTDCILYIVRHAQSEGNLLGFNQGQIEYPLTPIGENQALELAQKFSSIPMARMYSSDLQRAIKTAEIINQHHGLEIVTSRALRERNNGKFQEPKSKELPAEHRVF